VRAAAKRAVAILAANSENRRDFERVHGVTSELFLEIGVRSVKRSESRRRDGGKLRILWSGEFKHHKALHLLIDALAQMPDSVSYELRILGKGPLEARWKRIAWERGVERYCEWLGWLSLREAFAQYDWADVFVFTSLRDTAGSVVLEALSRGVPVVCLDHQGAGDIVTQECGVKIAVTSPRKVAADLANALVSLADDPGRLDSLSSGAVLRAQEFCWDRQGERLAGIYRRVLELSSLRGCSAQGIGVATEL
jgi:glycosyltransferase involved in cell wall biosynthesis